MSLAEILENMNFIVKKFEDETNKAFEEYKARNQKAFDNYQKSVYDIEQRHKDFMLKVGGKK